MMGELLPMKAIAIIEIPDGGKGKWYIDGEIRYTENESLMKKFDADMIPLKPMPNRIDWFENGYNGDWIMFSTGWNACIEEIEK